MKIKSKDRLVQSKIQCCSILCRFCRQARRGLDTHSASEFDRREVKAMPNLLLVISGACIVVFVPRETPEDLQKKKEDHDRHHDPLTSRAKAL